MGKCRWFSAHPDVPQEEQATRTQKLNAYLKASCDGQPVASTLKSNQPSSVSAAESTEPSELDSNDDFLETITRPAGAPMYPSLGAVTPFVNGDLAEPGVLQDALMARSYDNEVC
eukprot:100409-Prorocentrum_minimum.AAC.2